MSGADRQFRRRQQRKSVRLIPVPHLALGPAPTIAELRHEGERLFGDRAEINAELHRHPGLVAQLDQMVAAERCSARGCLPWRESTAWRGWSASYLRM